jgi:hypothetical protein
LFSVTLLPGLNSSAVGLVVAAVFQMAFKVGRCSWKSALKSPGFSVF